MNVEQFEIAGSLGELKGRISVPLKEPTGVLICLHGSPNGNLHGNAGIFDDIAALAPAEGYAVLQFSFCGSAPSGGSATQATITSQRADYRTILLYAFERFSCPVHVIGESAGATIASLDWQQSISSYVLLWPAFDLARTDISPYLTDSCLADAQRVGFVEDGNVILGYDFLREVATTDFSASFSLPSAPIFLAHGQSDSEVPYEQSLRALSTACGITCFLGHPEADHGFKEREQRDLLLSMLLSWLKILRGFPSLSRSTCGDAPLMT